MKRRRTSSVAVADGSDSACWAHLVCPEGGAHLARIFAKLSVSTRSELAAQAARRD